MVAPSEKLAGSRSPDGAGTPAGLWRPRAWGYHGPMTLPPNLFKPGTGAHPPHLAGRDGEIQAMAPTEAAIEARAAPAADVILHGPRGNGKTVLLDVIGDRLEQVGAQVVRATAHEELASWRALANALLPDDGWRGALRRLSERAGGAVSSRLSLFGVRLDLDLNQAGEPSARQMLASRSAEAPFALLVDEAHALSPEVGGRLLDASQSIRRMGAPFLLVLAGTPGIQQALRGMGTTFWERSLRMPVGRLKPGEDRDALMKPLEDLGCSTDADALARLLDAANLYPYFIQEVGAATVTALNARGAKHIDAAVADQALAAFSSVRTAFYDSRVDELDDAGLLPYAAALAQLFVGEESRAASRAEVSDTLAACCERRGEGLDARQVRRELVARGVVWARDGGYEPGNSSLLTHLAECAA